MKRARYRRLWLPLMAGVGGTAISLSVGLGQHKWVAIVIGELVTVIVAVTFFLAGGRDSDVGAVLGHRTDERQELVRLKAARVSALVTVAGSVVACVVAAALGTTYWPYEVLYVAAGISYLLSLRLYGADWELDERSRNTG